MPVSKALSGCGLLLAVEIHVHEEVSAAPSTTLPSSWPILKQQKPPLSMTSPSLNQQHQTDTELPVSVVPTVSIDADVAVGGD